MLLVSFTIPGAPVQKMRPRVFVQHGRRYVNTPEKVKAYEARVAAVVRDAWQRDPLDEPLVVELDIVCPRLKSTPKSKPGRTYKSTSPDVDNYGKSVLDGMEKGGLMVNDSRVVRLVLTKWHAALDEEPHVRVRVHDEWFMGGPEMMRAEGAWFPVDGD